MNTSPCPLEINSLADLSILQRLMGGALFQSLTKSDNLASVTVDGQPMEKFAASFIKANERLSSANRLEIYARQYWFRLLDCLYEDFPGLRVLLGQRKFHQLCRAYLASHPSESFTLRNLGSRLEAFIRNDPQWTGKKHAMAIDITRLEWAQTLAFDEAALPPLDPDSLLGNDPSSLRLGLQPYFSLLELDYAVDEFFLEVRKLESGTRNDASNAVTSIQVRTESKRIHPPKKKRLWLAVHRHDNRIFLKRLEHEAFLLLTAIQEGQTVWTALETALQNAAPTTDWATAIRSWFETWGLLGWFCKPATEPLN